MDEIKRLTPAQRARCNRLIRRLCANYDGGNCLPLDDGEGCVCVQMISYDDISSIKRIADGFNIAILLVHHLRKLQDSDDPFNDVSGSTGIIGAADTNFILRRKRSGNAATLLVSGRDVEYQELSLQFNDLVWELVERKNSEDIHKAELPKFLFRVVDFMECRTEWVSGVRAAIRQDQVQPAYPAAHRQLPGILYAGERGTGAEQAGLRQLLQL